MDSTFMKNYTQNFIKASAIGLLLATCVGCSTLIGHQYIKTNDAGLVTELKKFYKYQGIEYQIIADLTHPIALTNDGFTIATLGKNNIIKVINSQDDSRLSIFEKNGTVHYQYTTNGIDQKPSTNFIESTMTGVFNNTPLAAKARVNALYRSQGIQAVINQVENATNDGTKAAYIGFSSQIKTLDDTSRVRLIKVIDSISSDYTQAQSVRAFLKGQSSLDNSTWVGLLTTTHNIGSDYDLSQLLQHIAPKLPNNKAVHSAYFYATTFIGSDYDKYRLMSEIAKQPNNLLLADILKACGDIGSDYDAYKLVQDVASQLKTEQDYSVVFNVIESIGSDYDMQQALTSLPVKNMNKRQVTKAIEVASKHIGSDYDLANTLVFFAENSPLKSSVTTEFKQAILKMSSDTDKVKVYDVL
jgi:hypothetical protein